MSHEWMDEGRCRGIGWDQFFAPDIDGANTPNQSAARKLCLGCPVTAECLEYALETDSRFGVWGGISERQRLRLHQLRGKAS